MPLKYSTKLFAGALAFALVVGITSSAYSQESFLPEWIKTIAGFWSSNQISDEEFVGALQYLVKEGILVIPEQSQIEPPPEKTDLDIQDDFLDPTSKCSGTAGCIPGYVTENIDGDTLKIYGKSIRLVLVDAPEIGDSGYEEARDFIAENCPVGSFAIVDEDDFQQEGSHDRMLGVVHCNGVNLNDAILDAGLADLYSKFCSSSEFKKSKWARNHGC
ncbi:MAG: thermonuclease family protein [Nitrosopumilus sp.]|nr:thermonuclease family protein [Nitrosopumilus sp.]